MASTTPVSSPPTRLDDRLEHAHRQLAQLKEGDGCFHWHGLALQTKLAAESGGCLLSVTCDLGRLPFSVESRSSRDKAVRGYFALKQRCRTGLEIAITPDSRIVWTMRTRLPDDAGMHGVYHVLALVLLDQGQALLDLAAHLR
ncbi:MAG: hypothetical protein ACFB22_09125 [Rhodothalassiaceae bacterium]